MRIHPIIVLIVGLFMAGMDIVLWSYKKEIDRLKAENADLTRQYVGTIRQLDWCERHASWIQGGSL